jgi:hypothetical protein
VLLKGLGHFRNPMTGSVIKPETFRLVADYLNQLKVARAPFRRLYQNEVTADRNIVNLFSPLINILTA